MSKRSPRAIASTLAMSQISAVFEDPSAFIEDEHFGDLMDAMFAALPDNQRRDVLALEQVVELQNQVQAGLSPEANRAFIKLLDWYAVSQLTHTEGGFLVGFELGRRLGGAR